MTLLSNVDLRQLLAAESPIIQGVSPDDIDSVDSLIQPASIDLTVDEIYIPPESGDIRRDVHVANDFYMLPRGAMALIKTREIINFSADYAGLMFPKNGHFALKGIIVTNFGHVDPGYHGPLKYTVINFGSDPFRLEAGQRVASLMIFKLHNGADPDWKHLKKHDATMISSHAKVLSRDFLDMERRIEERVREQVEQASKRRDIVSSVIVPAIAIVFSLIGIMLPFYLHIDGKIDNIAVLRNSDTRQ